MDVLDALNKLDERNSAWCDNFVSETKLLKKIGDKIFAWAKDRFTNSWRTEIESRHEWKGKFELSMDTCGRGNFWIRQENFADSKISRYSNIWTSGQKTQTINGHVVQFARITKDTCLFLVYSASRVLDNGVIILYVTKNSFNPLLHSNKTIDNYKSLLSKKNLNTMNSMIWHVMLVEFRKPVPITVTLLHGLLRLSHKPFPCSLFWNVHREF